MQGCAGCAVPLGISSNVHPKYSTKAFKRFASLLLREPEARTEEFLETEMARLKVLFGGGFNLVLFWLFLTLKNCISKYLQIMSYESAVSFSIMMP